MKHRKWIGLILAFVLAAGLLPMTDAAFAADKTQDDAVLQEIAEQMEDTSADPFAFRTKKAQQQAESQAEDYPEAFDLRDVDGENYVTPVKFQNPFGTCWGFAAIAAAETSILGSGLVETEPAADTLDLSEKHLVNFVYRPLDDPSNSQNGEGMRYANKNLTLTDKFNQGGLAFFATNLFASGVGPNQEDRDIIDDAPAGTPADIYEYHGTEKSVERRHFVGDWIDFCYNSDDDWSIPEQLRFTQSYSLNESYILPSPAKYVGSGNETHYEYDASATAAIKDQLLQKRGVEISFCADTSNPNQNPEDTKYISENWAHYTYKGEGANHGVCIIGWDDNYDKANFLEGHQPPENGAWLVKNSWGSGEQTFPNRGFGNWGIPNENGEGTGYFWLSYYDMSLANPEALAFEKKPAETYYLDQYDYMPVTQILSADVKGEVSFSNVFQAEACQQLQQITCETAAPGSKVEYQIYLLSSGHKNPEDGVQVASGSEEFTLGGFHKIRLDEPVTLQRNQYYSVVLTQTTPDGKYNINSPLGMSETLAAMFNMTSWVDAVMNPGESYIKTGGTWHDYSDLNIRKQLLDTFSAIGSADNFAIKAVSAPKENLSIQVVGGDEMTMSLTGSYAQQNLNIRIRAGQGAENPGNEITWAVAEGSDQVFSIEANANNPTSCSVKALALGTGYLTVTVPGAGTQIIRVDVTGPTAPEVVSMKAGKKKLTVTVKHSTLYSEIKGWQIRYRAKGTKKWKMVKVGPSKTKRVLKKLKKGKRYQVQVRDYAEYNGKIINGDWSQVKTSKKIR